MSSWEQREAFLIAAAQRCLEGHKTFVLTRAQLVHASQISRGTVYNHFPTEADLPVAIATDCYRQWNMAAQRDSEEFTVPLACFLYHHSRRLKTMLQQRCFVIGRIMPNQTLLTQATAVHAAAFRHQYDAYEQWNRTLIQRIGELEGYDRTELVSGFIRGTLINTDDAGRDFADLALYRQFCYALLQLLGQSEQRVPDDAKLQQVLFAEMTQLVNSAG